MSLHLNFRNFRGDDDFASLASILTASENADGLPLSISAPEVAELFSQVARFDLSRDLVLVEVDGQAAGFGKVRWWEDPSRRTYEMTGFIRPEWRQQGIGSALLTWLQERARAIAAEQPGLTPAFLRVNATQYQVGLHALARQAGYGVKQSWVLMVRPTLDDIPETPLPPGLEVRPALPEQYGDIWYAVCEAYVPEDGFPPTREIPEDIINDPNFQPELWQVAWETSSEKVVGSVWTYINHAENKQLGILRGYTEGISTVPSWQRRGVAKALIALSLKTLRTAGMTESALICSGENMNNYRLYASCGFIEVKRDTVYEKPLVMVSQ